MIAASKREIIKYFQKNYTTKWWVSFIDFHQRGNVRAKFGIVYQIASKEALKKKENKATSAGAGGHYVNARLNLIDDSAAESLTSRNAAICPFAGDAPTSELDANIAEI